MMTPIDRTKYMDEDEARRLRGPLVWAVVNVAMLTGLRVSEMVRLTLGNLDLKRGAVRVWRHKRKPRKQETLAIPPELVEHLSSTLAVFGGRRWIENYWRKKRTPADSD